jgi:hypothetical protein
MFQFKGACANCGAMSHKTKDCTERPRKLGAKYTGKDIQVGKLSTPLFDTALSLTFIFLHIY